MNCIVCQKELLKPKLKFCSPSCKQKDFLTKGKSQNPNAAYNQLKGYLNRKLECINLLGGKCMKCGYTKNLAAMHFHHIDPKEKSLKLDSRSFSNRNKNILLQEVKKCIILCANCHAETHFPEHDILKVQEFLSNIKEKIKTIKKVESVQLICSICGGIRVGKKSTLCRKCFTFRRRKYERPSAEDLIFDLMEFKTCSKISKKYNCSHKSIEKWLLAYRINKKLFAEVSPHPYKM